MRASRLLRILLILQNRGRQTAGQLAEELEVARRTIHRDVDAMTEAGLPIIVHQGNQGGIELGFNYRTRLTGLSRAEATALAIQLAAPSEAVLTLGELSAFETARAKLLESFPDKTRNICIETQAAIRVVPDETAPDPYVMALAEAVRDRRIVRLRSRSQTPVTCHPARLSLTADGWVLFDARTPETEIPQADWGDLNISARQYVSGPPQVVR